MVDQQWKIKTIGTELTLKIEEVMMAKTQLKEVMEATNDHRRQKAEDWKLELFPKPISEVKQIINKKVTLSQY